jgi:VWFA-related protein
MPKLPVALLVRFSGYIPVSITLLVVSIASLALPSALCAQTPNGTSGSSATLRVNARLVVLDVVVTDKEGKPVDGLGVKDFQVFEDGKPQRIGSVEPPSAHTLPQSSISAGISAVFNPERPASFGHSPVSILVLDQLNTHFADSSFARRCLRDYLAAQPALLSLPTTLLTVSDNHFKLLQPFTRDRDALLRALAAAPTAYPWKLELNGKTEFGPVERLDQSLRAIEEIAQSYASISGRKNLVWVGGGFPTINPTTIDGDDAQEVKNALQHITNLLLETHITLYAVDPSSSAAGMTEITDSSQMEFLQTAGDALADGFDPFGVSDDFDRLGPVTGGRVVRGRNDVAQQISSAVELGAHFYTIAYSPANQSEATAQFRKISIVCLRPGLTARTRPGYYASEALHQNTPGDAAYDLTTAAESSLPLNGLHISAEPSAANHAYVIHADVTTLTWKPQDDGSATASVYILAVSLDAQGKMLSHTLHGMTARAKRSANLSDPLKKTDFDFSVQPSPKAITLRFIVRDNATGRMGSVDLPLKLQ